MPLPKHMYANEKTPLEQYIKKQYGSEIRTTIRRAKMQSELDKYGRRDASGGMVWTVGDMQRFFVDKDKRRKNK